jgi:ATP-dependent Clp protease ATP-binding subunit ClpA
VRSFSTNSRPALLRACGVTAEQASQVAATLEAAHDGGAAGSGAEPRIIGGLRFVVDQAWRIAAEAHAPYVGTEHLVVAILWDDSFMALTSSAVWVSATRGQPSSWPPCPPASGPS